MAKGKCLLKIITNMTIDMLLEYVNSQNLLRFVSEKQNKIQFINIFALHDKEWLYDQKANIIMSHHNQYHTKYSNLKRINNIYKKFTCEYIQYK